MSERLDKAIAAINAATAGTLDESKLLVAAKCRALLRGYDRQWKDAGYEAISVEQVYEAPLFNPETNAKSRTFRMAGKIDVMARLNGKTYIIDHKTTSNDIADPDSSYWRQLAVEGQVTHYFLLQWLNGEKPDGAVWDVLKKPQTSPRKMKSKAEHASATGLGVWFGHRISDESKRLLQTQDTETVEMYEARLTHDCCIDRPQHYFQRRSVPRMDAEVLDYAADLWQHGQDMLWSRGQKRIPPKNSGACLLYGSPCRFLGICSGHDDPESDRWQRKPVLHVELDGQVAADADVLTNSRIRNFQTCRRKHYYDYEIGIERYDEEERETLYFGTLWHIGLNEWWKCLLPSEVSNVVSCNT